MSQELTLDRLDAQLLVVLLGPERDRLSRALARARFRPAAERAALDEEIARLDGLLDRLEALLG